MLVEEIKMQYNVEYYHIYLKQQVNSLILIPVHFPLNHAR